MFKLKLSALCAATIFAVTSTASAESSVERGNYLVNAVMGCDGCHTPRPGGAFDFSKRFSGGSQIWDEKAYTVRGSNITPDPETGIGTWSEGDIKRALTEGVRPSGVPLAPQMPFAFYKILTPRDLDAVAAYIKSIAPVRNQVPPPVYKAQMHVELIPNAEKPALDEALQDPSSAASTSPPLPIAWNAIRAGPTARRTTSTGTVRAGLSSRVRLERSLPATSHRTRRQGSARGPTRRLSAR